MLSYEICKKLEEAGFPQDRGIPKDVDKGGCTSSNYRYCMCHGKNHYVEPRLSELIEAVFRITGASQTIKGFDYNEESWLAQTHLPGWGDYEAKGKSPEEAVAKLYLKLHNK